MSAFNDLRLFRIYEPHELGADGYPHVWHNIPGLDYGVKHLVRIEAGHRCERCRHPYTPAAAVYERHPLASGGSIRRFSLGAGASGVNWSPCDEQCRHEGPIRAKTITGEWEQYDEPTPLHALSSVEKQAAWRILTVHHLNGRKHDLRWWNLIAACQRCHLWLQKTVIMERVYPWEHDDYFKPHAAGWYAYAYRGENLTRIQTMRRLDDLLGLERAA